MENKTYRVEVVEIESGKVESVVGAGLNERHAEKREMTLLGRIDRDNYFVRTVEE